MRRFFLSVILIVLLSIGGSAQELDLAIGQWRSHLPYNAGPRVTQSEEQVFYGTEWSLVRIDKADRAVEFLDKVDGLSNVGIANLRYHPGTQTLLIAYNNSVLDLLRPNDQVETLSQIANFTNFVGERTIYQMLPDSDSTILLAASYGISQINLNRTEFSFTTFMPVEVENIARYRDFIYAATTDGIYRIRVDNPNPQNFGNWDLLGPDEGFPGIYQTHDLTVFDDKLFLDIDGVVHAWDGQDLQFWHEEDGYDLHYLSAEGAHLLLGYRCAGCSGGRLVYFSTDGQLGLAPDNCFGRPTYAVEDQSGRIWFGDRFRGFRVLNNLSDGGCEYFDFNSPYSRDIRDLTIHDNQLWLASGGFTQQFSYRFLDHGFSSFIDGQWRTFNRNNEVVMRGERPDNPSDDLYDMLSVAVRPDDGMVFAGSFIEGLVQYDGEQLTLYNEKNSSLGNATGDSSRTRITGLAFDEDHNLWIANHTAERPVSVFTRDGNWQSFRPSCNVGELYLVAVDLNGFKWFASNSNSVGLIVFDSGALDDPTDDRCRVFTRNNSSLPTNDVTSLTVDLDGDVWVGTGQGIVIFECGSGVFEPICQGTLRIFTEEDDFNDYLLANENVQTIAVDGANRKWVGTQNGVFVLSPEGEEELLRFTERNSPLPDDNILAITIDGETGEVFIGTDRGLVSYRSDATEADRLFSPEAEVFPNPVRPEYRGPITIRGLARDARVKITDINGRLVFETEALGGQAVWDGTDYNGRRANSGVYLVFASSNSRTAGFGEPGSAVARILFIRGDDR